MQHWPVRLLRGHGVAARLRVSGLYALFLQFGVRRALLPVNHFNGIPMKLAKASRFPAIVSLASAAAIGGLAGLAARSVQDRSANRTAVTSANAATQPKAAVQTRAAESCVPRFGDLPVDVQKDPGRADYDPRRLMQLGASAAEIYSREPRNEGWATGMEKGALADGLADLRVLVPELTGIRVECRTRACLVSWPSLGRETDKKVMSGIRTIRIAPTLKPTMVDASTSGVYLLYRGEGGFARDEEVLAKRYDATDPARFRLTNGARRRSYFEDVRAGKQTLPPELANAQLPQ
jgi:hypothetical protein